MSVLLLLNCVYKYVYVSFRYAFKMDWNNKYETLSERKETGAENVNRIREYNKKIASFITIHVEFKFFFFLARHM